jgi:methylamine utilization protein MauJ
MSQKPIRADSLAHPKLDGTWGLSGIETYMTIRRLSSTNPNYPGNTASPAGAPGKYKVTFILSRPGYAPLKENHISFADDIKGDSHIFIGDPNDLTIEIHANLPDGNLTLLGYPNEKGFLGKIEIEQLNAQSFGDANLKAYNALSTSLSRLSLAADVPLHVYRMITVELSTQNLMSSLTLPFIEQPVPISTGYQADKHLAKFASLYREALNSNSPNYQYLCYYKIIEGIRRIRSDRTRRENQEALARGEKPPVRERELLPSERNEQVVWLNSLFKPQRWSDLALGKVFPVEAVGRKLNDLIDNNKALDNVRNRIAHAVLRDESAETYNIDDGLHINEVAKWLPLCKCIARYLLKKEYPQLFKP